MNGPQTASATRATTVLFATVAGVGAFLLFAVQLVLGKRLLPWFGGTSALWTTCVMFFQLALVAGYAWAHALASGLPPRRQRDLQIALLAAAVALLAWRATGWPSPVTPGEAQRPLPTEAPIATTVTLLASAVGLPFLALAAGSPLLQAWLARLRPRASPLWLFAVSNAGSLLALLGYPLWIEPHAGVRAQGWAWSAGFVAYAVAAAACAVAAGRAPALAPIAAEPVSAGPPPGPGVRLVWLGLSAFPAVMMLAVTSHVTQEIAAVPLLWTVPLAVYLLTFVITFGWPAAAVRPLLALLLAAGAVAAVVGLERVLDLGIVTRVALWSFVLLAYGLAGHGELVHRRPPPARLTAFYLTVAAGGALGGVFNAVVAPRLFDGYWELHLAILAGPLLVAASWLQDEASPLRRTEDRPAALRLAIGGGALLLVLALWLAHDVAASRRGLVLARRSFYGVLRVVREPAAAPGREQLKLLHGRIAHGLQLTDPAGRQQPTTYFGPSSGVGLAIARHPRRLAGIPMRVGVVGLGVGTLAAWSRPGDVYRFYELDPQVAALSQGERAVFSYLRDAAGAVSLVLGDGRLALERDPPQQLDVLVLDAFSSDAIPTHLLTREAFSVYLRHLRAGGVLAVQITNRYLDLEPVVRGVAAAHGLSAERVPSYERGSLWSSEWMLVARERALLDDEVISAARLPPLGRRPPVVWTDEWSDLVRVLKH